MFRKLILSLLVLALALTPFAAFAETTFDGSIVAGAAVSVTAPFGGYKQSGIGREGGIEGLKEFTQLKAVYDHSTF